MTEMPSLEAKRTENPVLTWLLNPFKYIAGAPALAAGLAAIGAIALLGWITNTHFDGVLDIHTGAAAPLWVFVVEGLVDWLSLSLALLVAGMIVRRAPFRTVDLFGTQALARWPGLIVVAMLLIAPLRNALTTVLAEVMKSAATTGAPVKISAADAFLIGAAALVMLISIIWTVLLMYRAYAVSCDTRGPRAIISFIAALIAAEVASKVVLYEVFVHLTSLATKTQA